MIRIVCKVCFLFFPLCALTQITGFVFEDQNQNAQKDPWEKGIAGVVVSNQITLSLSDETGHYRLDSTNHLGTVAISMPLGFHGPYWKAFPSIEAGDINFPLSAISDQNDFWFIHASDTHIQSNNRHRMERFRAMTDSIAPAFVVVTGDLVRDALRVPEEEARGYYELYCQEVEKFSVPIWSVPGNHELFGIERHKSLVPSDHPLYGKKMFRHYLGPEYFSFNYGGVHFIGLNSVNYQDLWYYGDIDPVQLNWLQRDLEMIPADMPLVTFNHIPFVSPGFGLGSYQEEGISQVIEVDGVERYRHLIGNAPEVLAILREHPYPLALAGHFHSAQTAKFETQGNYTLFAQTSAITGPPSYYYGAMKVTSGFSLYHIKDGQVLEAKFIPLD